MVEGWDEGGEQQHEWIDDRRSEEIECIYIYIDVVSSESSLGYLERIIFKL